MAFLDWTHISTASAGTPIGAGLDTSSSKIEAASSLLYQIPASSPPTSPSLIAGYTAGVPGNAGLIRTMVRPLTADFWHPAAYVFVEMQGSVSATSAAYWFVWGENGSPWGGGWRLFKGTLNQIKANTATLLAAGNPGEPSTGNIYAIALQYQYSSANTTMYLRGFLDMTPITSPNTYDFSTLVAQTTYSDTSGPLTDGITAGVGLCTSAGPLTVSQKLGLYDVTQIYVP